MNLPSRLVIEGDVFEILRWKTKHAVIENLWDHTTRVSDDEANRITNNWKDCYSCAQGFSSLAVISVFCKLEDFDALNDMPGTFDLICNPPDISLNLSYARSFSLFGQGCVSEKKKPKLFPFFVGIRDQTDEEIQSKLAFREAQNAKGVDVGAYQFNPKFPFLDPPPNPSRRTITLCVENESKTYTLTPKQWDIFAEFWKQGKPNFRIHRDSLIDGAEIICANSKKYSINDNLKGTPNAELWKNFFDKKDGEFFIMKIPKTPFWK